MNIKFIACLDMDCGHASGIGFEMVGERHEVIIRNDDPIGAVYQLRFLADQLEKLLKVES